MRSHRSLLGLAACAMLAAASYAIGSLNDLTTKAIDYGARALRVVYDYVVTPFLTLHRPTADFTKTERHALGGAISLAQAKAFTLRLWARIGTTHGGWQATQAPAL